MSPLEELDKDKISDFTDCLCEQLILYEYFAYDSPNGTSIKLNYANGNFLILWSNYQRSSFSGYIGTFSPDGEVIKFIGCFCSLGSYEDLVNHYFETQI